MANYYVSGYMPPEGITTREQVRAMQRQLNAGGANLAEDGVWGAKTDAAYKGANAPSNAPAAVPEQYKSLYSELASFIAPQRVAYTPTSEAQYLAQIQAALRPGVDAAIDQRRKATNSNKAEIDADAAARGMGASTWVTDVKDRQSGYEADDIAGMEGQYGAAVSSALMNAMQNERANQFAADQVNAQLAANAQAQALGLAGDLYSQHLASMANTAKQSTPRSDLNPDDEQLVAEVEKIASDPKGSYQAFMENKSKFGKRYTPQAMKKAESFLGLRYKEEAIWIAR